MQDAAPSPDPVPPCPRCRNAHVVRNGHNRSGSANFLCRGCGRQFVADPKKGPVPEATKALVRRLLLERVGLRAIARSVGVSRSWLQGFANDLYRDETPWEPGPLKKSPTG
jgi:insertion element IS1 protein InsB